MHVLYTATEHIEGFCLVKANLFQVVTSILLEYESSIPPEHVRLIECSQDFLHEVHIAKALRQLWRLFSRRLRLVSLPSDQMNHLVVFDL